MAPGRNTASRRVDRRTSDQGLACEPTFRQEVVCAALTDETRGHGTGRMNRVWAYVTVDVAAVVLGNPERRATALAHGCVRRAREQRKEDFAREARRRQDELVRTILNETVNAYHRVKNVRRSLRAVVGESRTEALSIEDYDTWIHVISDQQLVFEELKRLAPLANEASPAWRLRPDPMTRTSTPLTTRVSVDRSPTSRAT